MSKNHRGKGILEKYKRGRGTCPVCKRTGVKIIHEREMDKEKILICKICDAVLTKKETLLKKKMKTASETETNKSVAEEKKGEKEQATTSETTEGTETTKEPAQDE